MQPPDSGILPKNQAKACQSNSDRRFSIAATPKIWLNRITRRWSISQKIGYGYVLSISIAVWGTGTGLLVGNYYENKGVEKFTIAQERHDQMAYLEKAILQVKVNQQRIIAAFETNTQKQDEVVKLLESLTEARTYLSELQSNLKEERGVSRDYAAKLKALLETYDTELESYTQLFYLLLEKVDTEKPTPREIQEAKQILQMTLRGKPATKFEQLSESLDKLFNSTVEQQRQAKATLKAARTLRLIIILTSMLLSMAIAAALALSTSRAIARPLQAVTKVAEQATQEGNFELQAPVTTEDEIGVLATSLNHLIQQVATQIRELKQAQAHLIQSEKMSGLGQIVAGIAHEINNPINFIHGNFIHTNNYTQELLELVALYQQYYPQPVPEIQAKLEDIEIDFIIEDLPKVLASMEMGTDRISQIVLSLRNFSRLDEANRKEVNIYEGIDNTLLLLSHRLNPGIQVIKLYDCLPLIECYPAQLNQLFMNILSNAIDELLAQDELSQPQIVIKTRLIENNQIEVRIRDNGTGIAPEIKDKIFDPFFTTKQVGQGTGMGLAICYQIVEKHRGKIEVISELGEGAEFVVTLPVKHDLAE